MVRKTKRSHLPTKIYFRLGGGFGDVIRHYFRGEHHWNWLKPLKEAYPGLKIKAICCSHNDEVLEFLKYNPFLDSVENHGWSLHGHYERYENGYTWIQKHAAQRLLRGLNPENLKLYLSGQDRKEINKIVRQPGPYVAIHPFSGLGPRTVLPPEEYPKLIDELIDEHGFRVVVLGGNHIRYGQKTKKPYEEIFDYQRDGLYNMVNQTNGRVSVELARKCSRFIGTWSCYANAAWVAQRRSVVIAAPRHKKGIQEAFRTRWQVHGDCTEIYIYSEKPNYNKVRARIIKGIL